MELILDIPMLANHRDKSVCRPPKAGNIEAVVTRNGRVLVRHPNRFHGNHRLKAWPFLQRRQGLHVRHRPDSSPHAPSMGIVECIKEISRGAPSQLMLDMVMKVLFDRRICLFVIGLQRQEVVATLDADLASDSRLAAHRINRHNTAFDG